MFIKISSARQGLKKEKRKGEKVRRKKREKVLKNGVVSEKSRYFFHF